MPKYYWGYAFLFTGGLGLVAAVTQVSEETRWPVTELARGGSRRESAETSGRNLLCDPAEIAFCQDALEAAHANTDDASLEIALNFLARCQGSGPDNSSQLIAKQDFR